MYIFGEHFKSSTLVLLDGIPARTEYIHSTTLKFDVPPGTSGDFIVSVSPRSNNVKLSIIEPQAFSNDIEYVYDMTRRIIIFSGNVKKASEIAN